MSQTFDPGVSGIHRESEHRRCRFEVDLRCWCHMRFCETDVGFRWTLWKADGLGLGPWTENVSF